MRIAAESSAAVIDWSTDYDHLRYTLTDTPNEIRRAVSRLLDSLRLRFAALDFVITPGGEWVFLEANPNGQWAWLQDATGGPIAAAIADALVKGPRP